MKRCVFFFIIIICPSLLCLSSLWSILSTSASTVRYSNLVTLWVCFLYGTRARLTGWQLCIIIIFTFFIWRFFISCTRALFWLKRLQTVSGSVRGRRETSRQMLKWSVLTGLFLKRCFGFRTSCWIVLYLWISLSWFSIKQSAAFHLVPQPLYREIY